MRTDFDLREQARNLFYEALAHSAPARRQAFVDQACAGDSLLRARVEKLLALRVEADKFFAQAGLTTHLTMGDFRYFPELTSG